MLLKTSYLFHHSQVLFALGNRFEVLLYFKPHSHLILKISRLKYNYYNFTHIYTS